MLIKKLNKELRERFNYASLVLDDRLDQKDEWVTILENSQLSLVCIRSKKEFRIYKKNNSGNEFVGLYFGPDAVNEITKYVQRTYSSNCYRRSWDSEGEIEISSVWLTEKSLHNKKSKLRWDATDQGLYFKISDDDYGNLSGFFNIGRLRVRHERIINLLMTL